MEKYRSLQINVETQPATRNFHRKSLFISISQKERLPQNRDSLFYYYQILKLVFQHDFHNLASSLGN